MCARGQMELLKLREVESVPSLNAGVAARLFPRMHLEIHPHVLFGMEI